MATTVDPNTAISKEVNIIIKDGQTISEKVLLLEIWSTGNVNGEKTIQVKDEGKSIKGTFRQIQFKFDINNNYIYTKKSDDQKLEKSYSGTASEFSISGLSVGNANTVIRTAKTSSASDLSKKYDGSTELVEVKVETVTEPERLLKTKGFWSSEKWSNGIDRTIRGDASDPEDPRFAVRQLENDGYCRILGNGTAEIGGKGRFYVFKKDEKSALEKDEECLWEPNIEVSCDIKVDSIISSDEDNDDDDDNEDKKKKNRPKAFINVGGCTNHFAPHNGEENVTNSNGRNYNIRAYLNRGFVGYEKETVHKIYDAVEAKNYPQDKMPRSKWFTYKFRQTVDGKDVKLEGSIKEEGHDEISFGSFTDRGQMTKLKKEDFDKEDDHKKVHEILQGVIDREKGVLYEKMTKKNQVWTAGAYSGLYIRLTGTVKTFIKNLSVKEL